MQRSFLEGGRFENCKEFTLALGFESAPLLTVSAVEGIYVGGSGILCIAVSACINVGTEPRFHLLPITRKRK